MNLYKGILPKDYSINEKYRIMLFIKKGSTAETYRVKGSDGRIYFLKLFNPVKLDNTSFDDNNDLLEIEFLKKIQHPNILRYVDSGEIIVERKKFFYLVLNFISGETLAEKIIREPINFSFEAKEIVLEILNGLKYLHDLPECVIHNEVTPHNIMLDYSSGNAVVRIIDFGFARSYYQSTKSYNRFGIDLNYIAPECFNSFFSPQSDLYSTGVLLYTLLFGIQPWNTGFTDYEIQNKNIENDLIEERKNPITNPIFSYEVEDVDEDMLNILRKSLNYDADLRFQSADEFIQALNGEIEVKPDSKIPKNKEISNSFSTKSGKGFSEIAGMSNLKEQMLHDVINVIRNPEEYIRHNIGLPNGMLLYGPPGCGKTFFAERFAEETGFAFIKVIASDIASIYVHGTQEKIAKVFKEAKEKAPSILFFDELDAMIPDRDKVSHQGQSSEVNEFLSQLDNTGNSGVFVIGSTNKPTSIDIAALRAGRLEKWYYIPPPDFEARRAIFELYLKKRPIDFGIDYDRLSVLTENYVSSDIRLLIDEASRKTIRDKLNRITMETLLFIISNQKPKINKSDLEKYEATRKKIEDDIDDDYERKNPIGFQI